MIIRLQNTDFVEFLKNIDMKSYEMISIHYGEDNTQNYIDNSNIIAIIEYNDGTYQALKFISVGLCNFSNKSKTSKKLDFLLPEDSVIETLETNPQAIHINKVLYDQMLKKDEKYPNEPTFKDIALDFFNKEISENMKVICEQKAIIKNLGSSASNVRGSGYISNLAESEIQRRTLINAKLIDLQTHISSQNTSQECPEYSK